jgi:hypothetical protein
MILKNRVRKAMNSWLYKGKTFTDKDIPEDAIGFVYEMQAIIDGKAVAYIGKKNFFSIRKKKFGKKKLAGMTDKRAKKYEMIKKLNYEDYYSSNKILQDAYKKNVPIKRYIVKICYSKLELTYHETKYQFQREVLEKEEYLNANILGKFYKFKSK